MTVWHLRDLVNRSKRRIKCEEVKVYHAPQYTGLTIKDMLEWAKDYPVVATALPDEEKEQLNFHRDYISTIIYTLCGQPFIDWVDQRQAERN